MFQSAEANLSASNPRVEQALRPWQRLPATTRFSYLTCGVALSIAVVWFLTLEGRHLLPSDEGRYAEIAREMFTSGDWVTIRYNGLKYFEKPPFQLWMTALAFEAFGVGEWQARLWVAISGAAGLVVTMVAARRWYGARVGLITGLVLLAAPAWNLGAHFNSLDMGLSGALAFVLASVLLAQHPATSVTARRHWMWAAWAAMAVAVLTKGLVGIVLPGLVLALYTLVVRDLSVWRRLCFWSGMLVLLVIAAPWFILTSQRNPEFLHFFFIHEHFQRYLSNVHHRDGPWWYFVPQLLLGFLPWVGLAWPMAKATWPARAALAFQPGLFLGLWAATIFIFFSLSGSKLPGYILPVYPALAVLAAVAIDGMSTAQWCRYASIAAGCMLIGLFATPLITRLGSDTTPSALYEAFAWWVAAACALGLGGLLLARGLATRFIDRSVVAYALTFFMVATIALRGHETFGRASSGVALAAPMRALLQPTMPLYSVRLLDHTLPFYLGHPTVMVEAPGELAFGTGQEPDRWVPTLAEFEARWRSGPRALALMSHPTYAELRGRGLPMLPVAADLRRVVVANFEFGKP